jgi:hypothetical protein
MKSNLRGPGWKTTNKNATPTTITQAKIRTKKKGIIHVIARELNQTGLLTSDRTAGVWWKRIKITGQADK